METDVATLKPKDLKSMLDRGERFVIFDVRNENEYNRWRIEGRHSVEIKHIPYFQFLENAEEAVREIPRDQPIVAVCAKGGSSAWVVSQILRPRGYQAANLEDGMVAWGSYYHPR